MKRSKQRSLSKINPHKHPLVINYFHLMSRSFEQSLLKRAIGETWKLGSLNKTQRFINNLIKRLEEPNLSQLSFLPSQLAAQDFYESLNWREFFQESLKFVLMFNKTPFNLLNKRRTIIKLRSTKDSRRISVQIKTPLKLRCQNYENITHLCPPLCGAWNVFFSPS